MPAASTPTVSVAEFAALLRDHGYKLGARELGDMLDAAQRLGLAQERLISGAWRALACHSAREWRDWPELFERYWHPQRLRGTVKVSGQTRPSRDLRQAVQQMHDEMTSSSTRPPSSAGRPRALAGSDHPAPSAHEQEEAHGGAQGGASRVEALDNREGQTWLPQELGELRSWARQIHRRLRPQPTRRWQVQDPGVKLDLRQTLRRSVAQAGELMLPVWRRRRVQPPRLFILVDVSRSMASHAAFFLRTARAFAQEAGARVFVFHTRLAEVTPLMHADNARVQEKINAVTAGFGGGTRIADCLQDFASSEVRHQLQRSSRIWVFSDGFDTGEPHELGEALVALQRRGARLTWFHPTRQAPAATAFVRAQSRLTETWPLSGLDDLRRIARQVR